MIKRLSQNRTWRKFVRNRLALFAFAIVLTYFVIGIVVMFGGLTVADTLQRYGDQWQPGFYLKDDPEQRIRNVAITLASFERALKKDNPDSALSEIEVGFYQAADKPHDELQQIIEECWQLYDEITESEDLENDTKALTNIDKLELKSRELFTTLEGSDYWRQKLALLVGTDRQGRSILIRGIYSIKIAMQIGVVTALLSVFMGTLLGAAAGYFGSYVDHFVIWLYSTVSSIPNLVLLVLLAYMFNGSMFDGTLVPVYVAFCSTFWVGPCRVIRGETMKIKELEFVQAAKTVGFGGFYILFRHIMPNTAHLMLINFSLLLIGAIKSEVILSFLGLGVESGASWGLMINDSKPEVINGFFWQIGTATTLMFVLVLAFNVLSDALQDVFDPKHN